MNKNKNIVIDFVYLTNLNTIKDNIFDLQSKLYLIPLYTWLTYYLSLTDQKANFCSPIIEDFWNIQS